MSQEATKEMGGGRNKESDRERTGKKKREMMADRNR